MQPQHPLLVLNVYECDFQKKFQSFERKKVERKCVEALQDANFFVDSNNEIRLAFQYLFKKFLRPLLSTRHYARLIITRDTGC
jgi:hypothetical protein